MPVVLALLLTAPISPSKVWTVTYVVSRSVRTFRTTPSYFEHFPLVSTSASQRPSFPVSHAAETSPACPLFHEDVKDWALEPDDLARERSWAICGPCGLGPAGQPSKPQCPYLHVGLQRHFTEIVCHVAVTGLDSGAQLPACAAQLCHSLRL